MLSPGSSRERDEERRRLDTVEARSKVLIPRMDRLAAELRPNGPIASEVRHAERVVAYVGDRRRRNVGHRPERRASR